MSYTSRFTRECMKPGYWTLGSIVVATNALKIIGLVALSIPNVETIERLLIAFILRIVYVFFHSLNIVDTIIIGIIKSSVVECKQKFIKKYILVCPRPRHVSTFLFTWFVFPSIILFLFLILVIPNEYPRCALRAKLYHKSRFVLLKH